MKWPNQLPTISFILKSKSKQKIKQNICLLFAYMIADILIKKSTDIKWYDIVEKCRKLERNTCSIFCRLCMTWRDVEVFFWIILNEMLKQLVNKKKIVIKSHPSFTNHSTCKYSLRKNVIEKYCRTKFKMTLKSIFHLICIRINWPSNKVSN